MFSNSYFSGVFFGNSLKDWGIAIFVFFVFFVVLKIFKIFILNRLEVLSRKTKTQLDDMLVDAINAIKPPFYVLTSAYVATFFVTLNAIFYKIILYIFLITIIYYIIKFLENLIDYGVNILIDTRENNEGEEIIRLGGSVVKIGLWIGAVVSFLSNIGYDITSLIAGLGIGGIAIALALKSVLSDLFGSLTILMDKPFKIGDYIVIGTHSGTVKKIGIKSTRIELLQGEELIVSNSDLTNSQIRNFGTMQKRRVSFNIGVVYNTPVSLLKQIPIFIEDIIKKEDRIEVDRVVLQDFGEFSLNFNVVLYVNYPEYKQYLKTRERINIAILEKFEKEKIEMAFPTQTIYIDK